MKPKVYEILSRAVEEGVAHGLQRAYKHDDNPTEAAILLAVRDEVMSAICEVFTFGDDV